MFVGEAPGFAEEQSGKPFVGKTGKELTRYCTQNGIDLDDAWLTNVVKYRPEVRGATTSNVAPTVADIVRDEPELYRELQHIQPRVVVAVGRFAARWFIGDVDMEDVHGFAYPVRSSVAEQVTWDRLEGPPIVIPVYHPAAGLHSSEQQPIIFGDFRALGQYLRGEATLEPPVDEYPDPDYYEPRGAVSLIPSLPVAVDTEGLAGRVWGLSYSQILGSAAVVRATNKRGVRSFYSQLLKHTDSVIFHHLPHDVPIVAEMLGLSTVALLKILQGRTHDTMLMSYILRLLPQGLKPLSRRLSGMKMSSYMSIVRPADEKIAEQYLRMLLKNVCKSCDGVGQVVDHERVGKTGKALQPALAKCSECDGDGTAWLAPDEQLVFENGRTRISRGWGVGRRVRGMLKRTNESAENGDEPSSLRDRWNAVDYEYRVKIEDVAGPMREVSLDDVEPQSVAVDYSARDADATLRDYRKLSTMLDVEGLRRPYDIDRRALPMIVRMMEIGWQVDVPYLHKLAGRLERENDRILYKLEQEVGHYVNPASSKQVSELLFDELRLPVIKMSKSGESESTDSKVLNDLRIQLVGEGGRERELRILGGILDYRERHKLRSTYAVALPRTVDKYSRIHTQLKYTRTESGRLCIAKGTLVEVVRDVSKAPKGIPIEDVRAGDLVYTFDEQKRLTIRPVVWAGKTGRKQVARVFWRGDGGHSTGYVDCTPEHRIRLVDGRYVKAAQLRIGDRILSLSRGVGPYGYARMWATGHGEVGKEHRFVYEQFHGEIPAGHHIHHANGNKLDNRVENLELLSASDHTRQHALTAPPERRAKSTAALMKVHADVKAGLREYSVRTGEDTHNWLGLTKEQLEDMLHSCGGKPTGLRDVYGIDFDTAKKYMRLRGVDWKAIRAQYTDDGRRITAELVAEGRRIHETQGQHAAMKFMQMGFYKWFDLQVKYGHEIPYNHKVTAVELMDGEVDVYDLEVEETHNFIAGELCVHNSSSGPNLQNISGRTDLGKEVRRAFVVPEGYVLLEADYSSEEMRILAHNSGDVGLLRAFHDGLDIHVNTAAMIFRIPYAAVQKWQRQAAKRIGFGIVYGISAPALVVQLKLDGVNITVQEAQGYIDAYLAVAYPAIGDYMLDQASFARKYGYVETMFDRRRYLPGVHSALDGVKAEAERIAVNHPIQGTGADIIKLAMAELDEETLPRLRKRGCDVEALMQVHDSLIFQVPEPWAERVAGEVRGVMSNVVKLKVELPVDVHWATNWAKLKETA
jgi:uracil-DNA glycosylase family 4